MKFNSQICTTREQSERLLALGLKPETADMSHRYSNIGDNYEESVFPYSSILALKERMYKPILGKGWEELYGRDIPAWSLHRLIEMISEEIQTDWQSMCLQDKCFTKRDDLYDNIVDCIEWLIEEGYFNKEYLVNQTEIEEHCKGVLEYLDYIRGEEE